MLVNADFSQPASLAPDQYQWVASPQPGVERVMLDRVGTERARATSIVRYAPGSDFPRHTHPGGEEILVLSGTFSEGSDHYPAGWYLRNPPGSGHQPFSTEGAVLFVKLGQMRPEDKRRVHLDTRDSSSWCDRDGHEVCPLFEDDVEQTCLQRLPPGAAPFGSFVRRAELLVLTGEVVTGGRSYAHGGGIRLPEGTYPDITAGGQGATLYLKTGLA